MTAMNTLQANTDHVHTITVTGIWWDGYKGPFHFQNLILKLFWTGTWTRNTCTYLYKYVCMYVCIYTFWRSSCNDLDPLLISTASMMRRHCICWWEKWGYVYYVDISLVSSGTINGKRRLPAYSARYSNTLNLYDCSYSLYTYTVAVCTELLCV